MLGSSRTTSFHRVILSCGYRQLTSEGESVSSVLETSHNTYFIFMISGLKSLVDVYCLLSTGGINGWPLVDFFDCSIHKCERLVPGIMVSDVQLNSGTLLINRIRTGLLIASCCHISKSNWLVQINFMRKYSRIFNFITRSKEYHSSRRSRCRRITIADSRKTKRIHCFTCGRYDSVESFAAFISVEAIIITIHNLLPARHSFAKLAFIKLILFMVPSIGHQPSVLPSHFWFPLASFFVCVSVSSVWRKCQKKTWWTKFGDHQWGYVETLSTADFALWGLRSCIFTEEFAFLSDRIISIW